MKGTKALFSRETDHWATPESFYKILNEEFHFDFDPCPLNHNIEEWDGLEVKWEGNIFVNPPYSNIGVWLEKAHHEIETDANIIVFLVPARTDTKWFHRYVAGEDVEIRFIKGRLKFGNAKHGAPFPSLVIIFRK